MADTLFHLEPFWKCPDCGEGKRGRVLAEDDNTGEVIHVECWIERKVNEPIEVDRTETNGTPRSVLAKRERFLAMQ